MSLFGQKNFTWLQATIFKISVLAFGIVVGAYWHNFFSQYLVSLLVITVVAGVYTAYHWLKN